MSAEENKRLAYRFAEIFNAGDAEALGEVVSAGYIQHSPGVPPGLEGLKQFMPMFKAAFPDLQLDVEDVIATDDKVAMRWTFRGTHQGELMGIPPTGRRVEFSGIDIWRVEQGKLAEHWDVWDRLGMMQQLGMVPVPG